MADRLRLLAQHHLDPSQVTGLGPALATAAALGLEPILLTPAVADKPGLLLLSSYDLRWIAADGEDQALASLEGIATAEVTTYDGRTVMVVLSADSRRTLFDVGDAAWTRAFVDVVNLALDDPGAAVLAADRLRPHASAAAPAGSAAHAAAAPSPSSRAARDRLRELDALLRDGLITPAEHAAQRATIISQI